MIKKNLNCNLVTIGKTKDNKSICIKVCQAEIFSLVDYYLGVFDLEQLISIDKYFEESNSLEEANDVIISLLGAGQAEIEIKDNVLNLILNIVFNNPPETKIIIISLEKEDMQIKQTINQMQNIINDKEKEIELLKKENNEYKIEIDNYINKIKLLENENNQKNNEIIDLNDKVNNLQKELEEIKKNNSNFIEDNNNQNNQNYQYTVFTNLSNPIHFGMKRQNSEPPKEQKIINIYQINKNDRNTLGFHRNEFNKCSGEKIRVSVQFNEGESKDFIVPKDCSVKEFTDFYFNVSKIKIIYIKGIRFLLNKNIQIDGYDTKSLDQVGFTDGSSLQIIDH